jgi:hypothetical protein
MSRSGFGSGSPSASPISSPSPSPRGIYGDIEIGNYDPTSPQDDQPPDDGDEEYFDDHDTISDLSFDEENYYNKDEIIMATRTASFKVTKTNFNNRTPPIGTGIGTGMTGGRSSPAILHFSSQSSNPDISSSSSLLHLGTMKGVFLPCIHTSMFGALLMVKLPYLVAQLGILLSLTAIFLSVSSTIFTLLSLIAIATNGKMKKSAGVYSLMKKYLGPELGGAIGIFHLIQKVGVTAMYCLAASETLLTMVEFENTFDNKTTVFAISLCGLLSTFCLFPKYYQRFDEISLGLTILTLLSFVIGTMAYVTGGWSSGMPTEHRVFGDCILPHAETFHDPRRGSEALIAVSFATFLSLLYASMSGVFGASTRSGDQLSLPPSLSPTPFLNFSPLPPSSLPPLLLLPTHRISPYSARTLHPSWNTLCDLCCGGGGHLLDPRLGSGGLL